MAEERSGDSADGPIPDGPDAAVCQKEISRRSEERNETAQVGLQGQGFARARHRRRGQPSCDADRQGITSYWRNFVVPAANGHRFAIPYRRQRALSWVHLTRLASSLGWK